MIFRFLKNGGLYKKLFISYIFFIILPFVIVSNYSYHKYTKSLESKIVENANLIIKQINKNVEARLNETAELTLFPYYNARLMEILKSVDKVNDISYSDRLHIESYLYNLLQYDKNIATISLYTNNSVIHKGPNINRISKIYRYENEEWFKKIKELDGLHYIDTYKSPIDSFSDEQIIFLGRALKNINDNSYIGMIIIELKTRFLDDILKEFDFTNNVSILLLDDSNNLIYNKSPDGQKIDVSKIINRKNKDYFIISSKSSFTEWNLFYILPYESIFNELIFLKYSTTTISAISILFTLFVSNLVSYRISGRVKNILSAMNKAQDGMFDVTIEDKGTDELKLISEAFNKTMKKIKQIIDQVYISELNHKQAQLDYLQRQINPHFIYNTLENIKMLGIINEHEEIVMITEALGKLLRYNASSGGRKTASIDEELSHVMSYLQIQNLRYGDKIKVNIDVNKDIRENEILKFTLQPLVENAVHHGIEVKKGRGTITIRGYIKGGNTCIDIIDDGKGIPKEKLEELNIKLDIKNNYSKRSIGIFNVNERIKLFYGNQYGLTIRSDYNIGTTVTITLPYKKYTPNLE